MSTPSPEHGESPFGIFMSEIVAFNGAYCTRETALRVTHALNQGDYDAMLHVGYIDPELGVHQDDVLGVTDMFHLSTRCGDDEIPGSTSATLYQLRG